MDASAASKKSVRHPLDPRYPVINAAPDFDEITANFGFNDYALWGVLGGISFPVGYATGKGFRVPAMWVTGALGTVGGFLAAYQQSSNRLRGYSQNDREVAYYKRMQAAQDETKQE